MDVRRLFKLMIEKQASDMYFRINTVAHARINGEIHKIDDQIINPEEMFIIANNLLATSERQQEYKEKQDVDFIHVEPGIGRFRLNVFVQRGTPAVVSRHVNTNVRTFEELNLPAELCQKFCDNNHGLFLLCGPAGNGKSTTIASMIDYINITRSRHIITIEDPIEFLFTDKQSLINQRELGIDVPSYTSALKHVTQQSPDIIYIGNIRDVETMRAAINATELGTFVFSTFHTNNSVQTIIRIVNFFPPHLHDEIRMQLSMILKGTISIRLLPRKDGQGRVPAYETMVVTPTIARLIRENKIQEIQQYIDEGAMFGMQSFSKSLVNLVQQDLVDEKDARQISESRDNFDLAMKGIKSSFD